MLQRIHELGFESVEHLAEPIRAPPAAQQYSMEGDSGRLMDQAHSVHLLRSRRRNCARPESVEAIELATVQEQLNE